MRRYSARLTTEPKIKGTKDHDRLSGGVADSFARKAFST
jgi:hypothetical protein